MPFQKYFGKFEGLKHGSKQKGSTSFVSKVDIETDDRIIACSFSSPLASRPDCRPFTRCFPSLHHVASFISSSPVLFLLSISTMTSSSSLHHVFLPLCFIVLFHTEAHAFTPQYRHPYPSGSHAPYAPSSSPSFVIVDIPPSPTPSSNIIAPSPRPVTSNSSMQNDTTTAAVNPLSIEGINTSATTLNYLVPTLAIVASAITLTILYAYASSSNPYRPYVTGASLSDYSLPNRGPAPQSRRYHATSLDPNAVPLPEVPSPSVPANTSQPAIPTDSRRADPAASTAPNSRARLQLDENDISFARRNNHLSSRNLR